MSIILSQGHRSNAATDLNMLQDVVMLLWAIVEFEDNAIGPDFKLGNHDPISGLSRNAVFLQLLRVSASGRAKGPVRVEDDAFGAKRERPNRKRLVGLKSADQLLFCPLA